MQNFPITFLFRQEVKNGGVSETLYQNNLSEEEEEEDEYIHNLFAYMLNTEMWNWYLKPLNSKLRK